MAYCRNEADFRGHRKPKRLAATLGIHPAHARGLCAGLNSWAVTHAQDGFLGDHTNSEIAEGADWDGDADELIAAMVLHGILDETEDGLTIHGYMERADSFREAKRKQAERAAKKAGAPVLDMSGTRPGRGSAASAREEREEVRPGAASPLFVTDDEVDLLYAHYKTYHPQAAKKVSKKRRRLLDAGIKNYGLDHCKAAIDGYHVSPHHTGENERGTKYLSLELIFRDDDHIEAGIAMAASPPRKKSSNMAGVEIFLDSLRKEDESARESERRSRGVWSGDGEAPGGVRGGQLAREGVGGDDQQLLAPPQPIPGAGEGSDVFDGTEEVPRPVPDGRPDGGARRGPPEG